MSKETIYREDAIKAVENVSENYTKEGDREWHPHIDFITQALVQVPSVSPKQGEWIGEADGYADGEPVYNIWYCSNCDYAVDDDEPPTWNFCPNCGCWMKGADDGNK